MLLTGFNLKIVQSVQVVVNLLEGGERSLAVIRDGVVILCACNVGNSAPAAIIDECL